MSDDDYEKRYGTITDYSAGLRHLGAVPPTLCGRTRFGRTTPYVRRPKFSKTVMICFACHSEAERRAAPTLP